MPFKLVFCSLSCLCFFPFSLFCGQSRLRICFTALLSICASTMSTTSMSWPPIIPWITPRSFCINCHYPEGITKECQSTNSLQRIFPLPRLVELIRHRLTSLHCRDPSLWNKVWNLDSKPICKAGLVKELTAD